MSCFEGVDTKETNNKLDGINFLRYVIKIHLCKDNLVEESGPQELAFPFVCLFFFCKGKIKCFKNLFFPDLNFSNFKWEHDFLRFAEKVERELNLS